jgi:sugar phosphate isomerase/epimerase
MTFARALAVLRGFLGEGDLDLVEARRVARAHGVDPAKIEGTQRVLGILRPERTRR